MIHLHRIASTLAAVVLTVGVSLSFAGAANAAGSDCPNPARHYPPGQCYSGGGAADRTVVPRGGQITVWTNEGTMNGNATASVYLDSTFLGTVTVEAGVAKGTFTVPMGTSLGRHVIVITGSATGATVTIPITVVAAQAAGNQGGSSKGGLPFTGANDIGSLVGAGAALVLVGAGTLVFTRRRRTQSAA